jgi:hypothetical protein
MTVVISIACALLVALCAFLWQRQIALRREEYIRHFVLPKGLFERLRQQHPHLTVKDCQLVAHGLRQFFLAHLKSGRRYVSMPSQVVDDLWHELILYTRNYQSICQKAFGRFLHHTPAVVLGDTRRGSEGLRRCWRFVCLEENIHPGAPTRLPLLFALDAKLDIPNGFRYVANCEGVRRGDPNGGGGVPYCGADLSSSGSDGGSDDASGESGGEGGDGGGDGCGGGGCGGGD